MASSLSGSSPAALCTVCCTQFQRYTCPRCFAKYCSAACYKAHGEGCTEAFYRNNAVAELQGTFTSAQDSKKMREILERVHRMDIDGSDAPAAEVPPSSMPDDAEQDAVSKALQQLSPSTMEAITSQVRTQASCTSSTPCF